MGKSRTTGTNGDWPTKNLVLLTEYAIVLQIKNTHQNNHEYDDDDSDEGYGEQR